MHRHWTDRKLRPLIRALEQRESELRRHIATERERVETEGFAQLGDGAGDAVDHAFARTRVGIESQLIEQHLEEIRVLHAARSRLEDGTFGICIDCGEEIDYERLKAFPASARCMVCQERRERTTTLRH
jgi:DnaK suppressor protein